MFFLLECTESAPPEAARARRITGSGAREKRLPLARRLRPAEREEDRAVDVGDLALAVEAGHVGDGEQPAGDAAAPGAIARPRHLLEHHVGGAGPARGHLRLAGREGDLPDHLEALGAALAERLGEQPGDQRDEGAPVAVLERAADRGARGGDHLVVAGGVEQRAVQREVVIDRIPLVGEVAPLTQLRDEQRRQARRHALRVLAQREGAPDAKQGIALHAPGRHGTKLTRISLRRRWRRWRAGVLVAAGASARTKPLAASQRRASRSIAETSWCRSIPDGAPTIRSRA